MPLPLSLDNIPNQLNPVHILTSYLAEFHFNIIATSVPRLFKLSVPLRFSN
jgi:hypothetical protein